MDSGKGAGQKSDPGIATETITITYHQDAPNPISVDKDSVTIDSIQEVEWDCAEDFVVMFDKPKGSPFRKKFFFTGKKRSGKPKQGTNGKYDYTIYVGDDSLDPNVIIR